MNDQDKQQIAHDSQCEIADGLDASCHCRCRVALTTQDEEIARLRRAWDRLNDMRIEEKNRAEALRETLRELAEHHRAVANGRCSLVAKITGE